MTNQGNVGKAYCFFRSFAKKEEIKEALPAICKNSNTPKNLEIIITKFPEKFNGDKEIKLIASRANDMHLNFILEGIVPKYKNFDVAKLFENVMLNLRKSETYRKHDEFVQRGKPRDQFRSLIYYKNSQGEYVEKRRKDGATKFVN